MKAFQKFRSLFLNLTTNEADITSKWRNKTIELQTVFGGNVHRVRNYCSSLGTQLTESKLNEVDNKLYIF